MREAPWLSGNSRHFLLHRNHPEPGLEEIQDAFESSAEASGVGDEPLSHSGRGIVGIPDDAPECRRLLVAGADLDVDLRAAEGEQTVLDVSEETAADASPLPARRDGDVVDPAAVAVIAGHRGGHQLAPVLAHEEQLGLHRQLALDVLARVVPGPGQAALLPERDDRVRVRPREGTDPHAQIFSIGATLISRRLRPAPSNCTSAIRFGPSPVTAITRPSPKSVCRMRSPAASARSPL